MCISLSELTASLVDFLSWQLLHNGCILVIVSLRSGRIAMSTLWSHTVATVVIPLAEQYSHNGFSESI